MDCARLDARRAGVRRVCGMGTGIDSLEAIEQPCIRRRVVARRTVSSADCWNRASARWAGSGPALDTPTELRAASSGLKAAAFCHEPTRDERQRAHADHPGLDPAVHCSYVSARSGIDVRRPWAVPLSRPNNGATRRGRRDGPTAVDLQPRWTTRRLSQTPHGCTTSRSRGSNAEDEGGVGMLAWVA
jgi:hypothetical protein